MTVFPSSFALHPDRLFPADSATRDIARRLYASVAGLPILSPHGHTDPQWFADDAPFPDPARLFIVPDHYVHRVLHSQGLRLEDLGVPRIDGGPVETDPRKIWRRFAENFHLFRGTPSWLWLNHAFTEVFGFHERLGAGNFDLAYDHIAACLERPEFRPRALFERFNIEALTTTESPLDDLRHHRKMKSSGWSGRVLTAFRPDPVVDPAFPHFLENLKELGRIADCDGAAVRNGAGRRTRRAEAPRMRSCYRPQHRADRVVIDWRFAIRRQAGWSGPADRRIAVAAGRHRARGESAQRRLQRHDLGDGQREGATWRLSLVDVRVSVRFVGSPGPRGHTSIEIQYVSRLIRLRNQPADLREPMPRIPVVDDDNRSASPRKAFPSRKATMSWSPNPAATASEPRTGLDRRQLG